MENLEQLEEFKNRIEKLYKLKKERILLKNDMNRLLDDMVNGNAFFNMSRNHLLNVLINKIDNLNKKIKIIQSNFNFSI